MTSGSRPDLSRDHRAPPFQSETAETTGAARFGPRPEEQATTRENTGGTEDALSTIDMQKALLISVLIATFAIPAALARREDHRGYAAVLLPFSIFTAIYVVSVLFIYPRLF